MIRSVTVRVLLLDDDDSVTRRVSTWLRNDAFDVVAFNDGPQAMEHFRRAPCPLALVDLSLGAADGSVVIADLLDTAPETRVIALAAFPEPAQLIAALRAGARDLLEKPIRYDVLHAAVERQLAAVGLGIRSEEELNRRLGARIRLLRGKHDRTQEEIASQCGITAAQLSQIELGKSATSTWTLARISAALGVPLDQLLRGI